MAGPEFAAFGARKQAQKRTRSEVPCFSESPAAQLSLRMGRHTQQQARRNTLIELVQVKGGALSGRRVDGVPSNHKAYHSSSTRSAGAPRAIRTPKLRCTCCGASASTPLESTRRRHHSREHAGGEDGGARAQATESNSEWAAWPGAPTHTTPTYSFTPNHMRALALSIWRDRSVIHPGAKVFGMRIVSAMLRVAAQSLETSLCPPQQPGSTKSSRMACCRTGDDDDFIMLGDGGRTLVRGGEHTATRSPYAHTPRERGEEGNPGECPLAEKSSCARTGRSINTSRKKENEERNNNKEKIINKE